MPIPITDVVVDGVYATEENQHRQVTKIEHGHVFFMARSGNFPNPWNYGGHSVSNPPDLATFAAACARVVSKPQP